MPNKLWFAAAPLTFLATQAFALNLGDASPSYDGKIYVFTYPNGDKPQVEPECNFPSGWTELKKGTGDGQICDEGDGSWRVTALGVDDEGDILAGYKSCGTGDCEVIARIPAVSSWTGHQETFTSFLIGISEGTGDSAWYFQAWMTPDGRPRCKAGTPGPDEYNAVGASNQSPEWLGVTHVDDLNEFGCWQSEDGSTWTRFGTYTKDMAEPGIGYAGGSSHDTSATTTAVLEGVALNQSLSIYTPDPPDPPDPPNHAPACSAIPNQEGTQGVAFSLAAGSFCSDEDDDPLTFSATGLSGRGLSIDTSSGVISGTPNATAVSQSPFNVVVTGKDDEDAEGQVTFSMTVSAPPQTGDVFTIASGTGTFNCGSQGVGPGDIVQLASGTRTTKLVINNCTGSAASPIVIRNDPSAGSRTTFRKSNGSSGSFMLVLDNMQNVVLDGTQKWSGAPAGTCGISQSAAFPTKGTTQCGIRFETDGNEPGPSAFIKIGGTTTKNVTIKGVEVDGSGTSGGGGIGVSCNDHSIKWTGSNVGNWREDIKILNNYFHDIGVSGGEGIYCGPNAYGEDGGDGTNDLPVRRVEIAWNYVKNTAREGINAKYWLQGPNSIHHNVVENSGLAEQQGQGNNISAVSGTKVDIYSNYTSGSYTSSIVCTNTDAFSTGVSVEPVLDPIECNIYNNIIFDAGSRCAQISKKSCPNDVCSGAGNPGKNGKLIEMNPSRIYNNTCIIPSGTSTFSIDSNIAGATRIVRDNLSACPSGSCTTSAGASGGVNSNNRAGTTGNLGFVNADADNYHITSSSPARDQGTANCPAVDIDGDTRPKQTACDQGADEYAP